MQKNKIKFKKRAENNCAEGAKKEISKVSVSAIPPKAELSQNRKIFCFGYRRACEAGGNANRKLLVGITPRVARQKFSQNPADFL